MNIVKINWCMLLCLLSVILICPPSLAAVSNGFDYPVGSKGSFGLCPTTIGSSSCYWLAQGFGESSYKGIPHLGEDWNRGSSYTDFGDPIYSASNGDIVYAKENISGWGKVIIIRSTLPNGQQVECLYAHLQDMPKRSGSVARGDQIGTIGDGDGCTISHLHFEIRYQNCRAWGSPGPGYSSDSTGWTNPSDFIKENRDLGGSTAKPDLVVKELYLSDHRRTFLPGEGLTIYTRIKNIGGGDVDHDVTIRYYLSKGEKIDASGDRVSLGRDIIQDYNLKSGDSKWEDKSTTAPNTPGLYNITVRADDDKVIDESNEDNNWFDPPLTFTVVPLPPPNWSIVNQLGDPAVYIFYNGKKLWAASWEILNALGFYRSQLITYPAGALNGYPNGSGVVSENLLGQLGAGIFVFQSNQWHWLPDWSYMDCRGGQHPENVIPITQTLMDMYGRGADITPCYIPVPPSPNFTAAPSSGKPPLTVTFTNTSIGDITSWLWDFGDGNTSSEQGPTHTYNNPASYTVKLTATGPGGQVTETKPNFITVIAPPEAKLIQNGSFEVGPVIPTSPGFVTLNSGDTFIQGWTVGGNGVDLNGNYWQPSDGKNSVDLSALAAGSLAQTFPTIPGARYNLRFDLAGNPAGTPAVKTLRVMVAEVSQDFSFDTTGKSLTNMGWVTKSLSFKATSPATTLTFESLDNTFYGPVIDNVRVFKRTLLPLDLLLLY